MEDEVNNNPETTTSSQNTKNSNVSESNEENLVNDLKSSLKLSLNDSIKIIQSMLEAIDKNIKDKSLKNESLETMSKLLIDLKSSTEKTKIKVTNSFEKNYFSEEE